MCASWNISMVVKNWQVFASIILKYEYINTGMNTKVEKVCLHVCHCLFQCQWNDLERYGKSGLLYIYNKAPSVWTFWKCSICMKISIKTTCPNSNANAQYWNTASLENHYQSEKNHYQSEVIHVEKIEDIRVLTIMPILLCRIKPSIMCLTTSWYTIYINAYNILSRNI